MSDAPEKQRIDYDREDHPIVLDDEDRSKNNPYALEGFSIEIRPNPGWPGLTPGGGTMQFDPPGMLAVVGELRKLRDTAASMPASLEGPTAGLDFGDGSWKESQDLRRAQTMASATVRRYTTQLIANLDAAIAAIEASARGLTVAEDAAEDGARAPGNGLRSGTTGRAT